MKINVKKYLRNILNSQYNGDKSFQSDIQYLNELLLSLESIDLIIKTYYNNNLTSVIKNCIYEGYNCKKSKCTFHFTFIESTDKFDIVLYNNTEIEFLRYKNHMNAVVLKINHQNPIGETL